MNTAAIRRFIGQELMPENARMPIEDETPLCDGIIDSVGLIELVAFLEKDFGIRIEDADLRSANFRTVSAIARLVKLRSAQG